MYVQFLLILASLAAIYYFWLRPVWRSTGVFADLWARENSFFGALCVKFAGIKQKLTAVFVSGAAILVSVYDTLVPIVAGVDTSALAAQVPSWGWPIIIITITAVFQYFRRVADRRHAAELEEAQSK